MSGKGKFSPPSLGLSKLLTKIPRIKLSGKSTSSASSASDVNLSGKSSKSSSSEASPFASGKNTPSDTPSAKADKEDMLRSNFINEEELKPLNSCDALFVECEEFIATASKTVDFTKKKGNTKMSKLVPGKINKWRAKRKGNDLFDGFDALQGRMDEADKTLKDLSISSTSNSAALIHQSLYLNARLSACAEFNRKEIGRLKPALLAGWAFFGSLRKYEEGLMGMVAFLDEIIELKRNEPVAYVPWALRQQMEEELKAEIVAAESDDTVCIDVRRGSVERRIAKVRKVITGAQKAMDASEKEHARCLSLLTHCLRSQLALLNFLHRCQSGIIIASTTGVSGGLAFALPMTGTSPTPGTPSNGLVSMSNPISMSFNHGAASSVGSGAPSPEVRDGSVTSQELGKLSYSYNHGAVAAQLRTGRPSAGKKVRRKENGDINKAEESLSFDVDSDEEEEEEADSDEEEEEDQVLVGEDYEQARTIEKSVRHMSKALTSLQNTSGLGLGDGVQAYAYDHSGCSDCTGSYDMANDCCMHMAASNMRAKQCSDRLLRLNAYREKIQEISNELDSLDWGGGNSTLQNST
jgi:hypothetical protein